MICVIGAGVAGLMSAYFLKEAGAKVVLIDRSSIPATGGSGCAGAFISPKIGKDSSLQEFTNEAFFFSQKFYRDRFPKFFHTDGVLRIPKNSEDEKRFKIYEKYNYTPCEIWQRSKIKEIGIDNVSLGFFFPEAGDIDAQDLCKELVDSIDIHQMNVESLEFKDGVWSIIGDRESIEAKDVVLATGYESNLLDIRYMGIKGLWGSRGDYKSSLELPISIHKDFSISSNRNGTIKIGATHIKSPTPCLSCDGRPLANLEAKAKELTKRDDFELIETFCGMRSTSRDHFPIVGSIVDVSTMLSEYPSITKGAKVPLKHYKNLYILNGLGGRGFVFAPFIAHKLSQYILKGEPIDSRINPDRLFWKWVRKERLYQ